MSHRKSTRREFLSQSTQTAAVLGAVAALGSVHVFGEEPPRVVRLGIIGCGGMMTGHVQGLVERREAVSFAWLCDVDPRQLDRLAGIVSEFQPMPPQRTSRFEDIVADETVDACIIATPHHWHAPIAVALMQAGKDVYIEKPISHVYDEGPLVIAAAKKYGRVVQQGSQMRSSPVTAQAGKLLAEGLIGEVKVARAWTAEVREEVKPLPDGKAPEGVDYDRWLGPAPNMRSIPIAFTARGGCFATTATARSATTAFTIWTWPPGDWASTRYPSRSRRAVGGCCCSATPASIPTT